MSGSHAFNQDTVLQETFLRLVSKYGIQTAVETGTYMGQTTEFLAAAVPCVVTVEASAIYFEQAKKLDALSNVRRVLGSSAEMLPNLIRDTLGPRIYFLDAHWQRFNPLLGELEAISAFREEPVILIHDFQVPGHPELGYDMFSEEQPICLDLVMPLLTRIYRNPRVSFNDDTATGARRGVLIAEPGG